MLVSITLQAKKTHNIQSKKLQDNLFNLFSVVMLSLCSCVGVTCNNFLQKNKMFANFSQI